MLLELRVGRASVRLPMRAMLLATAADGRCAAVAAVSTAATQHGLLKMFRFATGPLGYKIGKLLEDDNFSSSKIESLGFQAQLKLRHLNETLF